MSDVTIRRRLDWPDGWPRTDEPEQSRFDTPRGVAQNTLAHELRLMGAAAIVITYNGGERRPPRDRGVSVYWTDAGGESRSMACDRWKTRSCNMRALGLSIGALRGLERWGASSIVERAFRGFAALPAGGDDWRTVLKLGAGPVTVEQVKLRYRELALAAHPDHGGNPHEMQRLTTARAAALKAVSS